MRSVDRRVVDTLGVRPVAARQAALAKVARLVFGKAFVPQIEL